MLYDVKPDIKPTIKHRLSESPSPKPIDQPPLAQSEVPEPKVKRPRQLPEVPIRRSERRAVSVAIAQGSVSRKPAAIARSERATTNALEGSRPAYKTGAASRAWKAAERSLEVSVSDTDVEDGKTGNGD